MNIFPKDFMIIIGELSKHKRIDQAIFIDSNNNKALANHDFKYSLTNPVDTDRLCMMIDIIAENILFKRIQSANH